MSETEMLEAPTDRYAERLPAQLAALPPGESLFKGKRYALGSITGDQLKAEKRKLRNDASAAIARAMSRADEGAEFIAETGDWRTETNDLIVCVIITRKA